MSNPRGIWYTPVTGIWQTVWMEPVGETRMTRVLTTADIEAAVSAAAAGVAASEPGAAPHTITPKIRAWIDVFNIFNSRAHDIDYFYASRLPGEPIEGVADRHFHPVESRAVRLTVNAAF